jgi:hypothetical protein
MKSLEQFGADRTKRDGRMSHCRDCTNAARKARYYANIEHEQARGRQYYQDHREEKRAAALAWRAANLDKVRAYWREQWHRKTQSQRRPRRQSGHGGPEEWARMWEAQSGRCYLCQVEFLPGDKVRVDHDHDCCNSAKNDASCRACRRGLAHDACNLLIGIGEDDANLMLVIAGNFERASDLAKARIAALAATQGSLFGDGVATARVRSRSRAHDGPAEWARMWGAQAGCCYLCDRPMDRLGNIHVDHDHSCCPGGERTDSCYACRRGLCHAACNWLVGMVGEDMDLLRLIVDSFAPVQAAARERIAAKAAEQGTLDIAV